MDLVGRSLSDDERRVLDLLLEPDFPGVQQLRVQAASVVVTGGCGCGCPTIDLQVPRAVAPAAVTGRLCPFEAEILSAVGEALGIVLLFLDHGRLDVLECAYYDAVSATWPARDRLRLVARR